MKSNPIFIAVFFFATMLVACVSAESEMLKQARTIQNELLENVDVLDSTMTAKLAVLNTERSAMAEDSTLSADSTKLQQFMIAKEKIDNLANLQSELTDWRSNIKILPTMDEINGGAENPFGEKAKDQEILAAIKKFQEDFNSLKLKADAAMK